MRGIKPLILSLGGRNSKIYDCFQLLTYGNKMESFFKLLFSGA